NLQEELPHGGWVFTGYETGDVTFKPITVRKYGPEMLWQHAEKKLLMSASIISAQQMAEDLGLSEQWGVVQVPMSFPPENRPVHVVKVANMTNKEKDVAWPKMAYAIEQVLAMHPDDRVLVH